MPSKGHRAASRQAKLRQKRRRPKGTAQLFDTGPTSSQRTAQEPASDVQPERHPTPRPAPVAPAQAQPPRRSSRRSSSEVAPRYLYLGAELRRIGAVAVIIFVILAAGSFVLGS